MSRTLTVLIIAAFLFTAAACTANKPPEQAAIKSKNVLSVLRQMARSYEKRDLDTFMADVSGSYKDRDGLSKDIAAVFTRFASIHFEVHAPKMIIMINDKGQVRPSFTWDGEWTAADGSVVKDGGRTTLVFEPGSYKLVAIEGKNPFLAQPGDTPTAK